jgi:hypothetical protein
MTCVGFNVSEGGIEPPRVAPIFMMGAHAISVAVLTRRTPSPGVSPMVMLSGWGLLVLIFLLVGDADGT